LRGFIAIHYLIMNYYPVRVDLRFHQVVGHVAHFAPHMVVQAQEDLADRARSLIKQILQFFFIEVERKVKNFFVLIEQAYYL